MENPGICLRLVIAIAIGQFAIAITTTNAAEPPTTGPTAALVKIGPVMGFFFDNPSDSGSFTATPLSPLLFKQTFPVINFNPPAGTVSCSNPISVNEDTRPFTDIVIRPDGSCESRAVLGHAGQAAGEGDLNSFNAVFTGSFAIVKAGQSTLNFYSDDGWILGIGGNATRVSGLLTEAPAANRTPFRALPVIGAYNVATAPTAKTVVVNFPAVGNYPFEIDYSECCGDGLSLTLTANDKSIEPTTLFTTALLLVAVAVGVAAALSLGRAQWQRRKQNRSRRGRPRSVTVFLEVSCPRDLLGKDLKRQS